ncbi:microtubule-associated protein futsch-like [Anopheles aquasalis]|uniref:microtubule-associated protein futsch-like n=1 Tax=Anopheles aquasalis TaxID=42839 RepID=UPI00215A92E6|nr:microtubule-associated protein futsch-like [Anopheles aquasalis]
MNQEEIPTRVTRGALRRRSVDQDATPQKPVATTGVSGTPKKTTSTTKKAAALDAIQESDVARPSTPVGGRNKRRGASETAESPPPAPLSNKLVQSLKDAESERSSGRRSRNSSLSEENVNAFNASMDAGGNRPRTPARLRSSQEVLTSTPQTAPAGLRRSTRRNSVTSDDGSISVQSLPVTSAAKTVGAGLRVLKDETILEEDGSDEREGSISSEVPSRNNAHRKSLVPKTSSLSPREENGSPRRGLQHEITPTRGASKSPNLGSALRQPNSSTRPKNVSFSEALKSEDEPTAYPKTPLTTEKKCMLVLRDLRDTSLVEGELRVNAEISVSSHQAALIGNMKAKTPSKAEPIASNNVSVSKKTESPSPSPSGASSKEEPSESSSGNVANEETTVHDTSEVAIEQMPVTGASDISGVDIMEASIVDAPVSPLKSVKKDERLSNSWTQSVRGSNAQSIDKFSEQKQEIDQIELKKQEEASKALLRSPLVSEKSTQQHDCTDDEQADEQADEDETPVGEKSLWLDDEAMEVDGYQSGDSMDSEERREMEQNEIPIDGEDLGSEDTEEEDEQDEDNDSFIVPDDEVETELEEESDVESGVTGEESESNEGHNDKNRSQVSNNRSPQKLPKEDEIKETAKSPCTPKNTNSSKKSVATPSGTPVREETANVSKTPAKANTPTQKSPALSEKFYSPSTEVATAEAVTSPGQEKNVDDDVSFMRSTSPQESDSAEETLDATETAGFGDASLREANKPSKPVSRKSMPAGSKVSDGATPLHTMSARKSLPANVKPSISDAAPSQAKAAATSAGNVSVEKEVVEESDDEDMFHDTVEIVIPDEQTSQSASPNGKSNELSDQIITNKQDIPDEQQNNKEEEEEEDGDVNSIDDGEKKHGRKSMPTVPLTSAQFYLGGAKKRNTIAVGNTMPSSAEPKPTKEQHVPAEENSKLSPSTQSSSLVTNPFAKIKSPAAKSGSRLSLDSSVPAVVDKTVTKKRNSLPSTAENGREVQSDAMEVDEELDEAEKEPKIDSADEGNSDGDEKSDEEEQEKSSPHIKKQQQPKAAKPLEAFDLEAVLSRCNEVVRATKERKKQSASALQKKKDQKKRLREREVSDQATDDGEGQQEQKRNHVTTDEEKGVDTKMQQQDRSDGDGASKKKKRKKKVKNYLLEELAEVKKDRVAQALQHKLEQIERRKQLKKERRQAKKMLQNGENGADSPAVGIGAKLEKVKRKKEKKEAIRKLLNGSTEEVTVEEPPKPIVRAAVSAYAALRLTETIQVSDAPNAVSNGTSSNSVGKKQKHAAASQQKPRKGETMQASTSATVPKKSLSVTDATIHEDAKRKTAAVAVVSHSDGQLVVGKKAKVRAAHGAFEQQQQSQPKKVVPVLGEQKNNDLPVKSSKKSQLLKLKPGKAAAEASVLENPVTKKEKLNSKVAIKSSASLPPPTATIVSKALREVRATFDHSKEVKALKEKKKLKKTQNENVNEAANGTPAPVVKLTKRKRSLEDGGATVAGPLTPKPPAKQSKLKALQRLVNDFVEISVTPEKERLRRNFGFEERQATPKPVGFKVRSVLPTEAEELRSMGEGGRKMKGKPSGASIPEPNHSLPLPVWTSSGFFLEQDDLPKKSNKTAAGAGAPPKRDTDKANNNYIPVKEHRGFKLKTLRQGGSKGGAAANPNRIDTSTVSSSILSFKRQQLLDRTAHLREKKAK